MLEALPMVSLLLKYYVLKAQSPLPNIFEGAKGFKSNQEKDGKETKHDSMGSSFFRITIKNDPAEKYVSN